jgi:hypothetical protein
MRKERDEEKGGGRREGETKYLQVLEETLDVEPDGLGVVVAVVLDNFDTCILEDDWVVAPCGVGEVDFLSWKETVDEVCCHTECSGSRNGLDCGDLQIK